MPESFSPPAFVEDLNEAGRAAWSTAVLGWFRTAETRLPAGHRFFNLVDLPAPDAASAVIPWNAFPRKFTLRWPQDVERRWRTAEEIVTLDMNGRAAAYYVPAGGDRWASANLPFRDQDEYCEWRAYRDPQSGRLQRVVFTCENPEYWSFLAASDPERLVELYRTLVDPAVTRDDLFFQTAVFRPEFTQSGTVMENQRGRYNPYNRWNTTDGVVHLTHPANSLQAEVHLAADATLVRVDEAGEVLVDDARLICCAAYGSPNRSSDPTIGGKINELVRNGLAVTIGDPVGLYIGDIDLQPIEPPDGVDAADCWSVVRGRKDDRMILRAEFAPPEGAGFDLEDVLVGGEPLRFGSQLAELITIVIHGRGVERAGAAPQAGCDSKCCRIPATPALLTLADLDAQCPAIGPTAAAGPEAPRVLASLTGVPEGPLALGQVPDRASRV